MAFTDDEIKWVYERTNGRCFYCGEHLMLDCCGSVADRGAWDVDDFIPTLNKGECRRENWVPACIFCDSAKRNLFPWEYDSRKFHKRDENPDNYIKKIQQDAFMIKKTKCILVADDDVAVRRFVADVFRTSGFHVLEAGDGVEALRQIDAFGASVNVLLADVVMPRLNGAELARVILYCQPSTRIIFMSGHSDDVLDRHGIPASKLRCLKKPFTPDDLDQAVRDELKR